ncbi:MAG TPA: glycosyltransferase, partial [Gemmatimonadaceae bacterium]|nr:glycosyltransferase [Gemmatimonadaceae bacterium]
MLFLTHSFPRDTGDAPGAFLLRLATALREEDVETSVVAPGAPGLAAQEMLDGIPVERFRYAPRRYETLAYAGNMASQVEASFSAKVTLIGFLGAEFRVGDRARRSFSPDVIHAHWWFPNGLVGTWLARMSGKPLVTTLHGTDVRLARS